MKPLKPLKPLAPRKKIRTVKVSSSNIASHAYDPKSKRLTVEFSHGGRYRYSGVDPATAEGLASAPSKGGFLHSNIIGKFDTKKL